MAIIIERCVFCGMECLTRGHHIIPKCKSGEKIVQSCETCESFIHKNWTHNELRDVYNTVESILQIEKFQKFLKWKLKRSVTETVFPSKRGKFRDRNKYH